RTNLGNRDVSELRINFGNIHVSEWTVNCGDPVPAVGPSYLQDLFVTAPQFGWVQFSGGFLGCPFSSTTEGRSRRRRWGAPRATCWNKGQRWSVPAVSAVFRAGCSVAAARSAHSAAIPRK